MKEEERLTTGWTVRGSNPGGERFSACPDRRWGPPTLLYNGYRVFPGLKYGRSVLLTIHPLLVPWSWKSRAIPLPTLWATTGPVTGTLYIYLYMKEEEFWTQCSDLSCRINYHVDIYATFGYTVSLYNLEFLNFMNLRWLWLCRAVRQRSRSGNGCDKMAGNTAHGLLTRWNINSRPKIDAWILMGNLRRIVRREEHLILNCLYMIKLPFLPSLHEEVLRFRLNYFIFCLKKIIISTPVSIL